MTATVPELPWALLKRVTDRITTKSPASAALLRPHAQARRHRRVGIVIERLFVFFIRFSSGFRWRPMTTFQNVRTCKPHDSKSDRNSQGPRKNRGAFFVSSIDAWSVSPMANGAWVRRLKRLERNRKRLSRTENLQAERQ